jgi:N-acylglucosamine-6-phosphate 2-epimerase
MLQQEIIYWDVIYMKLSIIQQLKGGLIVSCQALEQEPLHSPFIMGRMARAAKEGGAVGIRANGRNDILAIKDEVDLPVIGIVKREYSNSPVYITPTIKEVEEVVSSGADIVAIDATNRKRPDGTTIKDVIELIKREYPDVLIMADVSTYEEGWNAEKFGADIVSTTLSGYTDNSPISLSPDFALVNSLSKILQIPIMAEGRISTPEDALKCLQMGAWAVVVGSAITRPQLITKTFTDLMKQYN